MKNYRTIVLGIGMLVACGAYAQDGAKTKNVTTTRIDQNTVVIVEKKESAFIAEKEINGITMQVFTQEQFEKLPKERKEYYLAHPNTYEILKKNN
ncbi:MAG: hypothetical protein ACXVC7_09320 [Bacteroidia bacterium]